MPRKPKSDLTHEYHLRVYLDRSELFLTDGTNTVFREGLNNTLTQQRYKKITDQLENGFLKNQLRMCREQPKILEVLSLTEKHQQLFDKLTDSVTSEVGRALVGLTLLQLTIKAIDPEQNIRLHKGGGRGKQFGWNDGISMRVLDKKYITPVLREEGLLKLNADGFMMTRTLAENYPYSQVYKAAIRGGREDWLNILDGLESGEIQPLAGLHYLITRLLNHASSFTELANTTLSQLNILMIAGIACTPQFVLNLIWQHIKTSTYAARIMEIAMHAMFQALEEMGTFGNAHVIPLSQMRSANKKHGNIGDIELAENGKIIEAWDAKYGKAYLRDELEELNDKLHTHEDVSEAGFVTSEPPSALDELAGRITEIEDIHGITVKLLTLDEWVEYQIIRARSIINIPDGEIAKAWLTAYTESLAQRRTIQAPIDEPCFQWLTQWNAILQTSMPNRV